MVGAGGSPLESALGHIAEAARDAIGRGAAADALDEFVALVGHAADALAGAQGGNDPLLAERLESAAGGLDALTAAPVSVASGRERTTRPVTRGAPAIPVPPRAEPAAPVPAPRAAPAAPAAAPVAAPALAATAPSAPPLYGDADALTASYLTLEQLIAERGLSLGSIDELLFAATPAPALAGAAATGAGAGVDVMPIEALVYRGERALRRALELRGDIDAIAAAGANGDPRLPALLREVFDLVELGLEPGR